MSPGSLPCHQPYFERKTSCSRAYNTAFRNLRKFTTCFCPAQRLEMHLRSHSGNFALSAAVTQQAQDLIDGKPEVLNGIEVVSNSNCKPQQKARQQTLDYGDLYRKVTAHRKKGKAFTAKFLASATGIDVAELAQQDPMLGRIAYQGAPGAFGEAFAQQLCPEMEPLPCSQYEDVFLALSGFAADKALVPIENSLGGTIHEVLDLFLRYKVSIEREAFLTTRQCLLACPGTKLEDIRRILSDTSSLLQCGAFVKQMHGVRREAVADSAAAAGVLAENQWRNAALIGSESAAELYGLEILERNIQDNKDGNITRFVLLTRNAVRLGLEEEGPHKTSVVFSFPEQPGRLFNALSAFALRDINLTKIESRPFKDDPIQLDSTTGRRFQYRFHIDFAGELGKPAVQNAIVHLQEIAPFVRILGCYPMDTRNYAVPSPIVETAAAEKVTGQLEAGILGKQGAEAALFNGNGSDSLLISAAAIRPIQQEFLAAGTLSAAYQGMAGAYSESAVLAAFPDGHPVPCEQFEDAFQAVSQYLTDRAVLPIENSLGGSIHAVYDLLMQYKLYIVGEVTVKVNHCLLANPGVKKSDICRVISHYQALAQVDGYTRAMPGVVREAVDDTAGAARMVSHNKWRDTAAVASARAGELYGLDILDQNIQDNKNNITRFLVLSRDPRVQSPSDTRLCKTSVAFSLKEGPGELFKACSVFALRGLDMSKIESRPMRTVATGKSSNDGFRYLFYIDFIASVADEKGQNALRHLAELAPFLRVLGCYPIDTQE